MLTIAWIYIWKKINTERKYIYDLMCDIDIYNKQHPTKEPYDASIGDGSHFTST